MKTFTFEELGGGGAMQSNEIRRWQFGFRFRRTDGEGDYETPYTWLPEFEATQEQAFQAQEQLQEAHPQEEWALIEQVGSKCPYCGRTRE